VNVLLEFVSKLIWPAVVIWAIYVFKDSVRALIGRLSHFKGGGFEADFEKALDRVEEAAEAIPTTSAATTTTENPNERRLKTLSEASPKATVLDAWREIESAIFQVCPTSEGYRSPLAIVRLARDCKLLPDNELQRLEDIRVLRNRVAHHSDVDISSAEAFAIAKVAKHLADTIRESGCRP
jgi:hypothetical protein